MAGDRHGQYIRAARVGDGASAVRRADARRNLRVASLRTCGNLTKGRPDALLKSSAAHVQRQVESQRRLLDETDHLRNGLLEGQVSAYQDRPREAILKVTYQRIGVIAE